MKRLRPYISVLIVLAFIAGPWLQDVAAHQAPKPDYCNCCQGPCHGCCCTVDQEVPSPVQGADACGCNMSSSPVPKPEAPLETVLVKVDDRPVQTTTDILLVAAQPPIASLSRLAEERTPVADESPPLFLLHASFLI